jgi:hypothetical protein
MPATSCEALWTDSAASRYDRMRNAFSPLISRMSAISCRQRARDRLSIGEQNIHAAAFL